MYVKLFQSILQSSIWNEPPEVCKLWITILALADEDGMVGASVGGLAHEARLDVETTKAALAVLEAPDPDSRNADNEGRRVEAVPGGFVVLNYKRFRKLQRERDRREYQRELMRKRRQGGAALAGVSTVLADVSTALADVSNVSRQAHAEAEADTEEEKRREGRSPLPPLVHKWNSMAEKTGLPTVKKLTQARRRTLATRLKDADWARMADEAIPKIAESRFLCGENDRGWRASFDWLLKPDSVVKVVEGRYANPADSGSGAVDPDNYYAKLAREGRVV